VVFGVVVHANWFLQFLLRVQSVARASTFDLSKADQRGSDSIPFYLHFAVIGLQRKKQQKLVDDNSKYKQEYKTWLIHGKCNVFFMAALLSIIKVVITSAVKFAMLNTKRNLSKL